MTAAGVQPTGFDEENYDYPASEYTESNEVNHGHTTGGHTGSNKVKHGHAVGVHKGSNVVNHKGSNKVKHVHGKGHNHAATEEWNGDHMAFGTTDIDDYSDGDDLRRMFKESGDYGENGAHYDSDVYDSDAYSLEDDDFIQLVF